MGWLDEFEKEAAKKTHIAYVGNHHISYSKKKTSKMNKSITTLILIIAGSLFSVAMISMLFSYHYDKYEQHQLKRIEEIKDTIINYPLKKSGRVYRDQKYVTYNFKNDKLVDSLITTDAEVSYKEHVDILDDRHITINLQYENYLIKIEHSFGEKFKRPDEWDIYLIDINGRQWDLLRSYYDNKNVSDQTITRLKSICNICKIE